MASRENITASWYRDTDWTLKITIKDSAGVVKDVTGWAITTEVKDVDCAVKITMTVGSGITIVDGPNGRIDVLFQAADNVGLDTGRYAYAVRRTDSGSKSMLLYGDIDLLAECG